MTANPDHYSFDIGDSDIIKFPNIHTNKARYARIYFYHLLKNIFKKQKLDLRDARTHYVGHFYLPIGLQQNWIDLFDSSRDSIAHPFTYFASNSAIALFHVLDNIGVNFKNILHVKTKINFIEDAGQLKPRTLYDFGINLNKIGSIGQNRIVLGFDEFIYNQQGKPIKMVKEYFSIRNVSTEDLERLRAISDYRSVTPEEFVGLSKRVARLAPEGKLPTPYDPIPIKITEQMPLDYARISGDLGVHHTTRSAAKICGFKKPFIQGLCSANHIICALNREFNGKLLNIQFTYCNPVYVNQTVYLFYNDNRFEMLDANHKVLVRGRYTHY